MLPPFLLPHTVTIERYVSDGAYGPVYAPAQAAVPAMVEDTRRQLTDSQGRQVTSSTVVFLQSDVADVPAGSRITLPNGRRPRVITTVTNSAGPLPTPDHRELYLE